MSFSFPTNLCTEEIQQCLADIQVYIDVNQLNKPTYEVIRPWFEHAVIALTGVSREEIMQPKFTALDAFEFPELHDESVPTTNFFRHLTRLMLICGVKDFSLNDLFKPDPGRLRRGLCAIINFAKFRDEKVALWDELEAGLAAKVAAEEAFAQEHEKNLSELRRLQAAHAARSSEVGAIDGEVAAQMATNQSLNKQQAALQAEVRALKQAANAATDAAAEARVALGQLQTEAEQLGEQIVQSPEKHRLAIAELAAAADSQRTYHAALTSASHDHERKAALIAKFEKDLQRCIRLQEELEGVVARKKEVSAATKEERENIAVQERKYAELAAEQAALRRQQAGLTEKMARLKQQAALRVEAAASGVEEQTRRREALEAEFAAGDARTAEKEGVIRAWRERTAEVKAAAEAQARSALDRMSVLRKAVGEWNRRLEAATATELQSVTAAMLDNDVDGANDILMQQQGSMRAAGKPNGNAGGFGAHQMGVGAATNMTHPGQQHVSSSGSGNITNNDTLPARDVSAQQYNQYNQYSQQQYNQYSNQHSAPLSAMRGGAVAGSNNGGGSGGDGGTYSFSFAR